MLVQLGAILATTLAVLYAIAFQPRRVAIGALAVGVSALLVAALPPRIRGGAGDDTTSDRGGWLRRTALSALPALGASAAAQPASPRPPWVDPQVRTREGCECKAITTDYTAPPGAPFQWAEERILEEGGPAWCDVEAGCPGAIDKEGDGPGDYHGWDRVDFPGPENRGLFIDDNSLAPPYSREVAEAVRRGATVPVDRFEDNARAVPVRRGNTWIPPSGTFNADVLGTTRPGPGPDNVQPRPNQTVVPETTPLAEGYSASDIATVAVSVAAPTLGAAVLIVSKQLHLMWAPLH